MAVFEGEPAIDGAVAVRRTYASAGDNGGTQVRIADCASLARIADLPHCAPGDAFTTPGPK